ncbi:MAG: cobaltochelatase subunit CobN, partial [Oscillospiraceae bacterium]|nr:cobaltochelatase subunit CobN [Oscillospiraceae bacterium]
MFKMVFIHQRNGSELVFKQVFEQLKNTYGDAVHLDFFIDGEVDHVETEYEACVSALQSADFVYVNVHGALPYFKKFSGLQKIFMGNIPSLVYSGIDEENAEMQKQSALPDVLYVRLMKYLIAGGKENLSSFIRLIMKEIGGIDCEPGAVVVPKWDGLYGLPEGIGEDEYLECVVAEASKPVIGILIHYHNVQNENTQHIDALMDSIKAHGAVPLAMYTNIVPVGASHSGLRGALEKYMLRDGKSIVDALIVTTGFALSLLSSPGDGKSRVETSVFEMLDVPVFQAMNTFYSYEKWRESSAGVDPMLLNSTVYQTEFDGQIITVTMAYSELIQTPYGTKNITRPIYERVDKVVRLSINWAKLRRKDMRDKKVAIILHNMPPRADMIGCAYGLDTPESVYNMYRCLRDKGLPLEYGFEDGQEIIKQITDGLTNDGRFLSESEMLERSAAIAERADYTQWFEGLPEKNLAELKRDWGDMPGEFMVIDDKILIPGILNGNLFIGLQPPRAYEEKAEEMYHSTDLVCPYQYLAFYRWLERKFGADVIIHVGTHGTIEWLPGKEIGLSDTCYPDAAIGDLPHVYPYIIDVPGEGVQAKRRTSAVILDHLIPSMTEGGMYGALEDIDDLIAQYYRAKSENLPKTAFLSAQIWNAAVDSDLHTDLGLSRDVFDGDIDAGIEKLHLWLSDIKSAKIKDGLHIFGDVPAGARYRNMLRLLVAVPNGDVPSLREGLCALYGEDYETLLANPGEKRADGRTHAIILEAIDARGRLLFESFEKLGFTPEAVAAAIDTLDGDGDSSALKKCLNFVVNEIKPRLNATTDEMKYFEHGIDGRFVSPGSSGAPSRGNATILPTGRNFYMIDPTTVPSRSAWETGKLLGNQLIQRYLD